MTWMWATMMEEHLFTWLRQRWNIWAWLNCKYEQSSSSPKGHKECVTFLLYKCNVNPEPTDRYIWNCIAMFTFSLLYKDWINIVLSHVQMGFHPPLGGWTWGTQACGDNSEAVDCKVNLSIFFFKSKVNLSMFFFKSKVNRVQRTHLSFPRACDTLTCEEGQQLLSTILTAQEKE